MWWLVGEQRGEYPVHPDQVVDQPAHRPVRTRGRRRPLFGSDLGDQLTDRSERAAELLDPGRALDVAAADAEVVAVRVSKYHPPGAARATLVVDHPAAEAKESIDLLIPPAVDRHQIKVHAVLGWFLLRHRDEQQRQPAVGRQQ